MQRRNTPNSRRSPIAPAAALWCGLFLSALPAAAGIVPDGGTATGVSTAASGKQTVSIAPTTAGVSYNSFSQFNVGKAGADFQNTGVNARYIVSEVTSTDPSLIEGPIAVVGPRASLVLANPNGITVNGGSFVNTGSVALTTGRVSFNDFNPAPGVDQRNIVLQTSQGLIEIGPDGLAGAFNNLELIAKQVRIDGPAANALTAANARIRTVAGDSRAEIDTSVSPVDGLTPWIAYTSPGTPNAGAIAVDITPLGSLTAGKIEIIVTDQGAGVRHAGAVLASVNDFTLSASGELRMENGSMAAARDAIVNAPALTMRGGRIQTARNIEIQSASIDLHGGDLRAGSQSQPGDITLGLPGVDAAADTTLAAWQTDPAAIVPLTLGASGGIGIYAKGRTVLIEGAQLTATQDLLVGARNIAFSTQWIGTRPQSAVLASGLGGVLLTADQAIEAAGAQVQGAAGVQLSAASLDISAARLAGATQKSSFTSAGGSIAMNIADGIHIQASDLSAQKDVTASSASFLQENDGAASAGVVAVTGGVLIETTGELRNTGSLLQGATRIAGNPDSLGGVTLKSGAGIVNESPSSGPLAVIFGSGDDVTLDAQGDITNHSARILSNGNLRLTATGNVDIFVDTTSGANGGAVESYSGHSRNGFGLGKRTSGFSVDYGALVGSNRQAVLEADGNVEIGAKNIVNRGGEIYANNGDVSLTAQEKITDQGLPIGRVRFERSCRLFFCSAIAESSVQVVGGLIDASGNVGMTAGAEIENIGGRILALNDITLTAPRVTAKGVTVYTALTRAAGMKAWFGDTWAQIYAADQGGSLTANMGRLRVNGTVYLEGSTLAAANGVDATGGIVTVRPATRDPVRLDGHAGLTSFFWK